MTPTPRIAGIDLIVGDLARSVAFYRGLGFIADAGPHRVGAARLWFDDFALTLNTAAPGARPYPEPRAADDPWFQHFCIAVGDMPKAFNRVGTLGATPISRGGPQLLPPSTGSVTAYKFRDPDGHPLELSVIPGSAWLADAPDDAMFLGVDHTAIAVADLPASVAFYEQLGFAVSGRSLNRGIEQDHLDGLAGVAVDIVAMALPASGAHLELLKYRTPKPVAAPPIGECDIAATRTVIAGLPGAAQQLHDPDGHAISMRSHRVD